MVDRAVRHKKHTVCELSPLWLAHDKTKRQAGYLENAGMFARISGVKMMLFLMFATLGRDLVLFCLGENASH